MKRTTLARACLVLLWSLATCTVTAHAAALACTVQWDPVFGAPTTPGVAETIVRAFTEYQGQLIVGGGFSAIAGSNISSVAAWDPVAALWQDMSFTNCEGGPQPVQALAVYQGQLYAAGVLDWTPTQPDLNTCTGPCAPHAKEVGILARWNPGGTEDCQQPTGGEVTQIGNWERISGSGIDPTAAAAVRALAVFDDGSGEKLYVGGGIPPLAGSGDPASHLFTWDGNTWGTVGGGVDGESRGLAESLGVWDLLAVPPGLGPEPGLYVGGEFSAALDEQGSPVSLTRGIARWDGSSWHTVGGGLDAATSQCPVTSPPSAAGAAALQEPIDLGGSAIGPKPVACVPRIAALELFDDGFGTRLFAGGSFRDVGGLGSPSALISSLAASIAVNNLAVWDGSGWQAVGVPPGDGVLGEVAALEVMEGGVSLAVAGQFSTAGGSSVPVSNIARWDGLGWSGLNGGLDPAVPPRCSDDNGNFVEALYSFGVGLDEHLYAGGSFDNASNPPAPPFVAFGAARWGCASTCFGDFDLDGTVGINEWLAILSAWGPCPACPAACPEDLNADEVVDSLDLDIVDANWGPCPP